jgi:hypothetical protein
MCVALNNPHREGVKPISKCFHLEKGTAPPASQMRNAMFRKTLAITTHIPDRRRIFEWFRYEAVRTVKVVATKETVKKIVTTGT